MSYKFFENKECEYYPCHKTGSDINCLFCFCPLYDTDCPGNYRYVDRGGKKVKSCIDCTFVHLPENYDIVMELIRKKNQ